ncbi:serine-rich adhesin for platelets-like isoform X1 [Oscarella lobularis]|uniref:serine-rich adhesin for platelets-like isoform X1 n=1 Tax=Oscarella lobularis TaxID=121494 RepID=UPI0033137757
MLRTLLTFHFLVVSSLDAGKVIVTRDTAGDTFTNPLGCRATRCPSTATLSASLCTCKCPNQGTWMQDTGDCVQKSSCSYSFRSDHILAMSIPSVNVDDRLTPVTELLYNGANAPMTNGEYKITTFEYLKDNSWTSPSPNEKNYFYFQSQGQKYYLNERIQIRDIPNYTGAIIKFFLKPTNNAPEGCLVIKTAGSTTYVAPTPQTQAAVATTSAFTTSAETTTAYTSSSSTFYSDGPTSHQATPSGVDVDDKASDSTRSVPPSSTSAETTTAYTSSSSTFYSDGPTSHQAIDSSNPTTEEEDTDDKATDSIDSTGRVPPSSTKAISDLPALPPIVLEQMGSSNAGSIAGGTIGAVFVAALVIVLIILLWRKRSRKIVTVSEAVSLSNPVYLAKAKDNVPETVVYECPDEAEQHPANDIIYEEIGQGPKAGGSSLPSNSAYEEPVKVFNKDPYEEPVDNGKNVEYEEPSSKKSTDYTNVV